MWLRVFKVPRKFAIAFLTGLLLVQLIGLTFFGLSFFQASLTDLQTTTVKVLFAAPLDEGAVWAELIDSFNNQNSDIEIDIVTGDYNTDQVKAIYTADLSGESSQYDLVYMDVIWLQWFADEGWLQDLSDLLTQEEQAAFLESELAAGYYQDRLYRIPFRADIGQMFYNTELMAELGVEPARTFDELMAQSQALKAQNPNALGYLWQGQKYEGLIANFVEVLAGYGGFWINPETGEVGLNRPEAIQAATFLANTIREGVSPQQVTGYSETESLDKFMEGESLYVRNWPSFWKNLQEGGSSLSEDQVNLAPVVAASAIGGDNSQACRGGWGFGIAKNAAHPEAARRAIKFLTSAAAQRQFVLNSAHLPSRSALYNDDEIVDRYPLFPEMLERLDNNSDFLRPQIPEYDEVSGILQEHLWQVLVGDVTAEQAMQAAAEETQNKL